MSEAGKMAQEHIGALHESAGHGPHLSRRSKATAIAIAVMAAALAIGDLNAHHAMKTVISSENQAGTAETKLDALDNHRTTLSNDKVLLDAVTAGQPPAAAAAAHRTEAKERTQAAQLAAEEKALSGEVKALQAEATNADNEYENLEVGVGALQIGIVLASVSIVAGALWLLLGGLAAGLFGIAIVVYALYLL